MKVEIRQDSILISEERTTWIDEILKEYWNNYTTDPVPKDRRMEPVINSVSGYSTENIAFLINEIVRRTCQDKFYLEVGLFQGRTLISAAYKNDSSLCVGVDNFSEFDNARNNRRTLLNNIIDFRCKNIELYLEDYQEAVPKILRDHPGRLGAYYYDGSHDYTDQLRGLEIIRNHIPVGGIIFIDDVNWKSVEAATEDFLRYYPWFVSALKIKTQDQHSFWWNGFQVLIRERIGTD